MKFTARSRSFCRTENSLPVTIPAEIHFLACITSILTITGCLLLFCADIGHCAVTGRIFPPSSRAEVILEKRIEDARMAALSFSRPPEIHCASVISQYYENHEQHFLWIKEGRPTSQAENLISLLESSRQEGLTPEDYHLDRIRSLVNALNQSVRKQESPDPEKQVDLELLLTDAYVLFGSHLEFGRTNPAVVDPTWLFINTETNSLSRLESAALQGTAISYLQHLQPASAGYHRLIEALRRYIKIQKNGGWPIIPAGAPLKINNVDSRIKLIRKRLSITGDMRLSEHVNNPAVFDEDVMEGVQHFQKRHGIDPDGVVGPGTLSAMNTPVQYRIQQIELNLERWRWIPRDLGKRYVLVNIADYSLVVVDDQSTVLRMRVVVGKSYRRTPVFRDAIKYMVLNPYWNVPYKIAVEDKLPLIRKNPMYLIQHHIKVFETAGGENAPDIDPMTIDWSRLSTSNFPYRFRQDPGPLNALGRIKFLLSNKFSIYLHDTPQRSLFKRTSRSFSSGCIRIEKPLELAEYLLKDDPLWSAKRISEVIASETPTVVRLKEPMPVYLLYWTAWVDKTGMVCFGKDIYDRDPPLDKALNASLNSVVHMVPSIKPLELRAVNSH